MDTRLFTVSQIRILEKAAIEQYQLNEFSLMTQAGSAAFDFLKQKWSLSQKIIVVTGPGNNGGDGYVLAHLAHQSGYETEVLTVGELAHFSEATHQAFSACQAANIPINQFSPAAFLEADLIVDAIFGIGLTRKIEGEFEEAITAINDRQVPVLAIDIPSGIDGDSGQVLGVAIKAEATITFIGLKQGLFCNDAFDYCGKVTLAKLDLPDRLYDLVSPSARLLTRRLLMSLTPRKRNSQKGNFGHVLIIGGNKGMAGAARLAAEAALRAGAGLVTVATWPEHQGTILAHHPEIMCAGVKNANEIVPLLAKATVLVIGPGLGLDAWGQDLLQTALARGLPAVIDADALNLLGPHPVCADNWILTPHPGEAARLLNLPTASDIQGNRFAAIDQLVSLGGIWVLKGAGTLIKGNNGSTALCPFGNPGMASGGMGDALSGIIAGLIAQRMPLYDAASLGVMIHALAGDRAASKGERGLVASDLIGQIRYFVNERSS